MSIKEELQNAPPECIALVITNAEQYVKTNIELIKYLVEDEGTKGIYVTVARPYESVKSLLGSKGVNTDNLFFIDCITLGAGGSSKKEGNVLFITSPQNLTEISLGMSQAISKLGEGEKFMFLDSLSTLLIYNQSGTVAKFAHFLTVKIREWGIKGILISLEKETDEKLISQLSIISDVVAKEEGGD